MSGDLYEVICSKYRHKISNCPYIERVSSCVNCPYAKYLKREITNKNNTEENTPEDTETVKENDGE